MLFKRSFLLTFLVVFCLGTGSLAGFFIHAYFFPPGDFPILNQAYDILSDHALIDLPEPTALEYGMIHGMLQAYGDPHTIFVEPVQHELQSNDLQGSFGGIGVHLGRDESGNVVLFPFPDGPAAQAGIQEGDRLLAVESLKITPETSLEDVQATIRGPEGRPVTMQVTHPPDFVQLVEIKVRRANFPLPSVTWHLHPDETWVGVIKINVIAASTPDEIQNAVQDLSSRGATHFILDLRDNGGGLLSTGVDTARLFLREGEIIQQQYRGQEVETFRVERPGPLVDLPLAVLVNHGTASAAEIIAGALQAHQRAPLVGAPSFGKDSIQLVFDLQDGSSLHVTAARWWIPGLDQSLAGHGLQPEVPVPTDVPGNDPVVSAAIQVLQGR